MDKIRVLCFKFLVLYSFEFIPLKNNRKPEVLFDPSCPQDLTRLNCLVRALRKTRKIRTTIIYFIAYPIILVRKGEYINFGWDTISVMLCKTIILVAFPRKYYKLFSILLWQISIKFGNVVIFSGNLAPAICLEEGHMPPRDKTISSKFEKTSSRNNFHLKNV